MKTYEDLLLEIGTLYDEFLTNSLNKINLHYSIGMSLRNNFLWFNEENYLICIKHFKINSIDTVSSLILKDLIKKLKI